MEWLEEVELKLQPEGFRNELSEKRAALEKVRSVQREVAGHADTAERLQSRLSDQPNFPAADCQESLKRYQQLRQTAADAVSVSSH